MLYFQRIRTNWKRWFVNCRRHSLLSNTNKSIWKSGNECIVQVRVFTSNSSILSHWLIHKKAVYEVNFKSFASVNESTNSRVVMWAVFEALILVAMTVGQIYYLKRFFEVRRVIWTNNAGLKGALILLQQKALLSWILDFFWRKYCWSGHSSRLGFIRLVSSYFELCLFVPLAAWVVA